MAKKRSTAAAGVTPGARPATRSTDRATIDRLKGMSDAVVRTSLAQRDPFVDVPSRTLSNTSYNKKRRTLQMGDATQRRNLFNLAQARKFMQTMLLAAGCKSLVDAGKTLSLRGMYYKCLHTIPGTKEKTLSDQSESDVILEDLEVTLGSLREELHIFAKKAGTMVGNITIVDSGDEIDCRRMGSGGYAIPSITEPNVAPATNAPNVSGANRCT